LSDLQILDWSHLLLFFIGMVGSVFGTVVGGASLLTIPSLLLLGLPPHVALGTDRFGIVGIGIAGWYKFHQKGVINYKIALSITPPGLVGAFIGSNIVLEVDEAVLRLNSFIHPFSEEWCLSQSRLQMSLPSDWPFPNAH